MAYITTPEGLTVIVQFNLFNLKQRLHALRGSEISLSQIARESGLHRNTIERIYENKIDRVDLTTLAKLVSFFHKHGMLIEIGDLFSLVVDNRTHNHGS